MAEIHSLVACSVGKHKADEILKSQLIGEHITRSIGQLSVRAVPKPRNIEYIPGRPAALRLLASLIDIELLPLKNLSLEAILSNLIDYSRQGLLETKGAFIT